MYYSWCVSGAWTGNEFVNADNRKSISNFLYYTFPFHFFFNPRARVSVYIYGLVIVVILLNFQTCDGMKSSAKLSVWIMGVYIIPKMSKLFFLYIIVY